MQRGKTTCLPLQTGIVLFESRLFLITSNGELRRNRHDIYASNIYSKQQINSTPNSSKIGKLAV
jgi:hypothetical protein